MRRMLEITTTTTTCLPEAPVVFVFHTISDICDSMSKRYRKGVVSSTYMSFIGVRLSMKGRILFYWVVVHTSTS